MVGHRSGSAPVSHAGLSPDGGGARPPSALARPRAHARGFGGDPVRAQGRAPPRRKHNGRWMHGDGSSPVTSLRHSWMSRSRSTMSQRAREISCSRDWPVPCADSVPADRAPAHSVAQVDPASRSSKAAVAGPSMYQPVTVQGRIGWELARIAASMGAFRFMPRSDPSSGCSRSACLAYPRPRHACDDTREPSWALCRRRHHRSRRDCRDRKGRL